MRVNRTFCFLDLCGFTPFTDEHGDQEAVAVLGHLRAVLRAEAENSGVRVTKWLGDGAMLSGVDATAVITCAAEVRDVVQSDGRLALRGGICEGKVIMFEGDDYIGGQRRRAPVLEGLARPAAADRRHRALGARASGADRAGRHHRARRVAARRGPRGGPGPVRTRI
jgi:adenylate cyclase